MNTNEQPTKTGPRDVFSYLLIMIALYVGVVSLGALIFQYINLVFPDPLSTDLAIYIRQALRWPLAVLVVVFPFYVWFSSYVQKDLIAHPEKRELRTRKWFLYFTLFATTLVIAGDLVSLIFQFLNGEFTARFLLKVLTVFLIAAAVFVYYSWNLRKSVSALSSLWMRIFVQGTIVLVSITIIAGFFFAGSPYQERLRQFDQRRINDLQSIQFQVTDYWQSKQILPPTLDALRDDLRGFVAPRDPETNTAYEYRSTGDLSFELCASFKTSSSDQIGPDQPMPAGMSESFLHGATRTCFPRTIDPDRYKR